MSPPLRGTSALRTGVMPAKATVDTAEVAISSRRRDRENEVGTLGHGQILRVRGATCADVSDGFSRFARSAIYALQPSEIDFEVAVDQGKRCGEPVKESAAPFVKRPDL